MFGGYLRSQVYCTSCNYKSNTYDPFLDLSLEVSKKDCNSLSAAFLEFTRKETLDSKNRWKCSSCKKYVCATKQLTVFRPPLSLCIQLKRFSFGGDHFGGYHNRGWSFGNGGGSSGSKIQKSIEFPATLKLPLSDGRKCEYLLTGVIIHVGGSATSGHYTAFVKKPGSQDVSRWYHMDDSFVEAVNEKTVLKQRDAYVLFYCRKEVKLELPTPPATISPEPEVNNSGKQLLGNISVSKWDNEENNDSHVNMKNRKHAMLRESVANEAKVVEKNRKRKLYLDNWDNKLDEGRTKKVKIKKAKDIHRTQLQPKNNPFHRIQSNLPKRRYHT